MIQLDFITILKYKNILNCSLGSLVKSRRLVSEMSKRNENPIQNKIKTISLIYNYT